MTPPQADDKITAVSPHALIDYITRSRFDRASVRPWERETLSSFLGERDNARQRPESTPQRECEAEKQG